MLFFLGTLWFLTLGATAQAKTWGMKDKILEKLFKISGLNIRYQEVESFLDQYKNIDPKSKMALLRFFFLMLIMVPAAVHGHGAMTLSAHTNQKLI